MAGSATTVSSFAEGTASTDDTDGQDSSSEAASTEEGATRTAEEQAQCPVETETAAAAKTGRSSSIE